VTSASNDYGLWGLVFLNVGVFVGFAYSFFKPTTLRDWRSFGVFRSRSTYFRVGWANAFRTSTSLDTRRATSGGCSPTSKATRTAE